jgi:hypothetical protein
MQRLQSCLLLVGPVSAPPLEGNKKTDAQNYCPACHDLPDMNTRPDLHAPQHEVFNVPAAKQLEVSTTCLSRAGGCTHWTH